MNEVEYYVIKMNNNEYLSFYPQDSDDYLEGYTVKDWFESDRHTLVEVQEILLFFKEGKNLSGMSNGKVIPKVFIYMKDKETQPISYMKVISRLDEEFSI